MQNLFEGHLVRLRALEPGDAETLFRHRQDTEISRRDARIQWQRSLASIRQRLENPSNGQATDDIELAITTLDNQLVGGIDVQSTDRRNGTFSIGIGLTERSAWGVDALLGRITRAHNDLDLVLALDDLTRGVAVLVRNGFGVEEEALGRVVLGHAEHGRIDLHPVTFDAYGNAVQVQLAASPVVYPSDGFVAGWIRGRAVACIAADVHLTVASGCRCMASRSALG